MKQIKNYIEDKVLLSWLWLRSEKGQGLVEYALIIVLMAVAAIVFLTYLAGRVNNTLGNAANRLPY